MLSATKYFWTSEVDQLEIGQKWNWEKDDDDVSYPCYPGDASLQFLESDSVVMFV